MVSAVELPGLSAVRAGTAHAVAAPWEGAMQTAQQITTIQPDTDQQDDFIAGLLHGFRFRGCQTREDWEAAIAVRRSVYRASCGYEVPVPDDYDRRSWLFIAEDATTGKAVGTMRVTPRWAGSLEAEEYFTLP